MVNVYDLCTFRIHFFVYGLVTYESYTTVVYELFSWDALSKQIYSSAGRVQQRVAFIFCFLTSWH